MPKFLNTLKKYKAKLMKSFKQYSEDLDFFGINKAIGKFTGRSAYKKAAEILQKVWDQKKKDGKHSKEYYAAQIARQYSGIDVRELVKMIK